MKRQVTLKHEFVENIPNILKDGTIYISIRYATVVHKCCCGCGYEVVTPITPTDWKLIFDGQSISLYPSIGNWSFACKSHYWIEHDRVKWAPQWSQERISAGETQETFIKQKYFSNIENQVENSIKVVKQSLWQRFKEWLS